MEQISNVFGISKYEQISNQNKKFELKVLRNGTNFQNGTKKSSTKKNKRKLKI
jgi:hypothetical protein